MNGILGLCQSLLESPLDEPQRKDASMILTSANALMSILNDLLVCVGGWVCVCVCVFLEVVYECGRRE